MNIDFYCRYCNRHKRIDLCATPEARNDKKKCFSCKERLDKMGLVPEKVTLRIRKKVQQKYAAHPEQAALYFKKSEEYKDD